MKVSPQDILLYEACPQKWHLTSSGHKGSKQMYAFYRFSSALHYALSKYISSGEEPEEIFSQYWERYRDNYPLIYFKDEAWDSLHLLGLHFLKGFTGEYSEHNINQILSESSIRSYHDDIELHCRPDVIGDQSGSYIVVDFKVTPEPIMQSWVDASDQMTAGVLATAYEFNADFPIKILVVNFAKSTKKIHWLYSKRDKNCTEEYIHKIHHIMSLMAGHYHPKRSLYAFYSPCKWCDFKEMCFGKSAKQNTVMDELRQQLQL